MSEKPIIFATNPIKAILTGRKIQTRRPFRRQPPQGFKFCGITDDLGYPASRDYIWAQFGFKDCDDPLCYKCTYGRPGDRLWVRETWQIGMTADSPGIAYRATSAIKYPDWLGRDEFPYDKYPTKAWEYGYWIEDVLTSDGPWRPSIHMPRWASRITLEITDVRIEQVQNISAVNAANEGMFNNGKCWQNGDGVAYSTSKQAFQALWDSIYASRGFGWNVNPWVWVICFKIAE